MPYEPQARDTAPEIDRLLVERWRQQSPAQKLQIVAALSEACRELARAGIRERHPDASAEEVRLRLAALWLDRETMLRLFGWDPEVRGY